MAGTALEVPLRGKIWLAPVKNRSDSELFAAGGWGPQQKSPEAMDVVWNEIVLEGQRIESLMKNFGKFEALPLIHLHSFVLMQKNQKIKAKECLAGVSVGYPTRTGMVHLVY